MQRHPCRAAHVISCWVECREKGFVEEFCAHKVAGRQLFSIVGQVAWIEVQRWRLCIAASAPPGHQTQQAHVSHP